MTDTELRDRATERARSERLHTFKVTGEPVYLVRSRQTEPGSMHQVRVAGGRVVRCGCAGWEFRKSCTHAAAVTRRLEREAKTQPAADQAVIVPISRGKSQLFRDGA